MKRFLLGWALALLLVHASAFAAEGAVVGGVAVEGNRRVDEDAVRAAIATKEGQPLDPRKLDDDLQAVMKLGFFSDVVIEERGDPERPEVVFRVVEKPTVREVSVVGNAQISADDLKDAIEVKPWTALDPGAVKKSVKKIQDKYVEKGYFLAEVSSRVEGAADGQVSVFFDVNERAKVQVSEIRFIGNTHVPRSELTAVMSTQEGSYLSFLTSAGNYREDVFQRDLQDINFVYGDKGYIYAKVEKPAIALSPDKRYLYITLRIDEGEQYRVGEIDFCGDLLHEKEELRQLIKVQQGRHLRPLQGGQGPPGRGRPLPRRRVRLRQREPGDAGRPGHPHRRPHLRGRPRQEGPLRAHRDLRQLQDTRQGHPPRAARLRGRALRRVGAQHLQGAGHRPRLLRDGGHQDRAGSADDRMVVRVVVKEKSTGTFQVGAGFSSYENFILTGQISQNNFFGWGQTLSLAVPVLLHPAARADPVRRALLPRHEVDLRLRPLRDAGSFSDLHAARGRRRRSPGATSSPASRTGCRGRRSWRTCALFGTYTNEYVKVTPNGLDITNLYKRFRSGTTSSLRLSLQWDKRDNRLFPTKRLLRPDLG